MRRDKLLDESNREFEERYFLPFRSTVMPAARERTTDLTRTGREGAIDPLALYRVLRGTR